MIELISTNDLLVELQKRCPRIVIGVDTPDNSRDASFIWGDDYYYCLGLARSLLMDIEMAFYQGGDDEEEEEEGDGSTYA